MGSKFNILSLDIVLTHKLPFGYFKQFIDENAKFHEVYLNLYCLIELYRSKISGLLVKAKNLRNTSRDSQSFDPRYISDPEFNVLQLMVGRSMVNMLEYIHQNYNTHFKGLFIDDIEKIDLELMGYEIHRGRNISFDKATDEVYSQKPSSSGNNSLKSPTHAIMIGNPNSKSELIPSKDSFEFEKQKTMSPSQNPRNDSNNIAFISVESSTIQTLSAKDIYLICGEGQLEPYRYFINYDINRANEKMLSASSNS